MNPTRSFPPLLLCCLLLAILLPCAFADDWQPGWRKLPVPVAPRTGEPLDAWRMVGPLDVADPSPSTHTLARLADDAEPIWIDGEPLLWMRAPADGAGWVSPPDIAPGRAGQRAWLALNFELREPLRAALVLEGEGELQAWWDGRPLFGEFWTPPGPDRYACLLEAGPGRHRLLLASDRPRPGHLWRLRARLASARDFREGRVAWPRWGFDRPAPWDPTDPPRRLRWGDPALADFLGIADEAVLRIPPRGSKLAPWQAQAPLGKAVAIDWPDFLLEDAAPCALEARCAGLPGKLADAAETRRPLRFGTLAVESEVDQAGRDLRAYRRLRDSLGAALGTGDRRVLEILDSNRERILADPEGRQPLEGGEGWRLLGLGDSGGGLLLRAPAGAEGAPPPLALLLPPRQADVSYAVRYRAALAAGAAERGWVFGCLDAEPGLSDIGRHERLESALRRLRECGVRYDGERVYLIGFGDAGPTALDCAAAARGRVAAVALVDAPWQVCADGLDQLQAGQPRASVLLVAPASADQPLLDPRLESGLEEEGLFVTSIDSLDKSPESLWQEVLAALAAHHLTRRPERIELAFHRGESGRAAWLQVREPIDPLALQRIAAELDAENQWRIHCENIRRFDILLEEMPGQLGEHIAVFRVDGQKIQILGPGLPKAVAVERKQREAGVEFWAASAIDREAFGAARESGAAPLLAIEEALPRLAAAGRGGVGDWLAAAARSGVGADVALLPATGVLRGQQAGPVRPSDTVLWCLDAVLTTTSVPAARVRRAVALDLAGPRRWVSAGVGGVLPAQEDAATSAPSQIFVSTQLDGRDRVVLAGWRNWIEAAEVELGLKVYHGAPDDRIGPEAGIPLHPTGRRQRMATQVYLQAGAPEPAPRADLGRLPVIWAVPMKKRP